MQVRGGKEVTLKPGQTFYEGPDDVHVVGRNASHTKPANAVGNRVARTLAADRPELVRTVILFAAGGKVPPTPHGEQALKTIFDPKSTDADVLENMKYMVGNPANIQMAWQVIKPCRAPQAAGIERTAMNNTPLKDWWAPPGKVRYLVVQGTDDQIAPPENGELLKQELGARVTLVSLPGAGHLFLVTDAKKTDRRRSLISSLVVLSRIGGGGLWTWWLRSHGRSVNDLTEADGAATS
jgi:pimeloyl-ACP methyl ester carboxylesterase